MIYRASLKFNAVEVTGGRKREVDFLQVLSDRLIF